MQVLKGIARIEEEEYAPPVPDALVRRIMAAREAAIAGDGTLRKQA